jgi:mannose-6-phosphate isomerase-like protein (cupin superfamily)
MNEQGEVKSYQPGREYFFQEGCFINELSNDSGDPAVSIARARVEPGNITRWHYLRGITERYVIVSGTGVVETGDLPGTQVSAGDVVSIPPGVRQRIRNVGKDELVFLAICTPRFQQENYVDCDDGE